MSLNNFNVNSVDLFDTSNYYASSSTNNNEINISIESFLDSNIATEASTYTTETMTNYTSIPNNDPPQPQYYNVGCNYTGNYYNQNNSTSYVAYSYDNSFGTANKSTINNQYPMDSSYLYDYKPAMATTNLLTKAIIDAPIPSVVYPKNENLMENVNYLNTPKTATVTPTASTSMMSYRQLEDNISYEDNQNENIEGTSMTSGELDQKLQMKRERNRIAARKCRDKKLNKIKFYESRIDGLKNEIIGVENEIANLNARKNQLRLVLVNYCCNQMVNSSGPKL